MTSNTSPGAGNSVKPTLLAFHGSGSNAIIHNVQLSRLNRVLRPHFNIENIQAPFPCPAGPGVLPFFEGCGPYARWLPPSEKITIVNMKRGDSTSLLPPEVEDLTRSAVLKARAAGGKVVGLIGFSQGTRVVAGLLRGTQIRRALAKEGVAEAEGTDWLDFSFALSVCGSFPPPLVPQSARILLSSSSLSSERQNELLAEKIHIPTFHVLGNQDEWKWAGESLLACDYDVADGKSEVVEWNMGHHYPIPVEDNEKMTDWLVGQLRRVEDKVGEKA